MQFNGNPARPLSKNALLSCLDEADQRRLEPYLRPRHLERGDVIHEPGQSLQVVQFPLTAVISILVRMQDERQVEVATVGNEGISSLAASLGIDEVPIFALCQIPGESLELPAGVLKELVQSSPDADRVLRRHALTMDMQVSQLSACNRIHLAEQRLCRWLLMCHDRVEGDEVRLTQQFLAEMLSVRRATVTEIARELQEAGLIRYRRGQILIVNRDHLEAAACECYSLIRNRYQVLKETTC